MNFQLLFADSLASTLLDWLGYATGLPVLARLHTHIQLMLESVLIEPVLFCGNDGGDVPEKLDKEDVVDKPGTMKATGFTCKRRRKSTCWTNSWKVFPNIFRCIFGEDIADLCTDCVDVQWLLALVGGGNPSDSPRRSSWTYPRTWMVPCRGWSSQNLISSNKFYLSICGFLGIVPNLGEIISFALSFTLCNSEASICVHLLKVCHRKSSFPNFSSRVPDVLEKWFG